MFYARLMDEMVVVAASGDSSSSYSSSTSPINNCPSCGHNIQDELLQNQGGGIIHKLSSDLLPSGVKFDPNDQEIIEHLEAKVLGDNMKNKLHPLIHQFIPTLEGDNGICYTHPAKLPGVSKDGQVRHFFHRPSKAYTTGTRKRRKVHSDESIDGSETRWHKTGKTRAVVVNGTVKGYKKILVLYTNYGRQRKPEKTNWVMHQYHIGHCEDENDGEMVVSKVFYQTQPRQSSSTTPSADTYTTSHFPQQLISSYIDDRKQQQQQGGGGGGAGGGDISSRFLPILGGGASSFIRFAPDSTKE